MAENQPAAPAEKPPERGGKKLGTGIPGLDTMLYGGIPETNQVIIAGGPGSGKSLLCLEALIHFAEAGMTSAFISFEEKTDEVVKNVEGAFPTLAPKIEDLLKSGALSIVNEDMTMSFASEDEKELGVAFMSIVSAVEKIVMEKKAKCVAVDSISLLKLIASNGKTYLYRKALLTLLNAFRQLGITTLFAVELESIERKEVTFSPEFFLFDGIIILYQSEREERRVYNLEVIKMRGSHHSLSFAPYDITSKGFKVFGSVGEEELM